MSSNFETSSPPLPVSFNCAGKHMSQVRDPALDRQGKAVDEPPLTLKSAVLQLVLFDSKPRRCSVAFLNWIDQRFRKQRRYSAASCSAALASSRYAAACGFRRALSLSGATAPFSVREFAMCRPCVTPELGFTVIFTLLDSLVARRPCLRALVVACLDARLEIKE